MLKKNQINNIVNFNLSLLDEALRQTELRLKDALLTKEDLDKKLSPCYRFISQFVLDYLEFRKYQLRK